MRKICVATYLEGKVVLALRELLGTTRFWLLHGKTINDFYVRNNPPMSRESYWVYTRAGYVFVVAQNIGGGYADMWVADEAEIAELTAPQGTESGSDIAMETNGS